MTSKKKELSVSVVIPTLNEEKNIAECLKSIKEQTLKPLEVIVCDGYSTDKTRKIARKYADKVVLEKKRSAGAERQRGAMLAKGEIIAFIDCDTIADSKWIEKLAHAFENGAVGAYGNVLMKDGSKFDDFMAAAFNPYIKITYILGRPSVAGMNMAVRRDAFKKIGGFDLKLKTAEDIDLFSRLAKIGKIAQSDATVRTSARRIKRWGYRKFFLYHFTNLLTYHATGKSNEDYEDIR